MPSLPSAIQRALSAFYAIDGAPRVDAFVRPADEGDREALLVRDDGEALEVELRLPRRALERAQGGRLPESLDELCQVVEGVSHFVYLAERARRELPTTRLELELQAEVDKYVLLVVLPAVRQAPPAHGAPGALASPHHWARVRARLFEEVSFADPEDTEPGERYRVANDLAARLARRLDGALGDRRRFVELRGALRRFYRAGQSDKIAFALAA